MKYPVNIVSNSQATSVSVGWNIFADGNYSLFTTFSHGFSFERSTNSSFSFTKQAQLATPYSNYDSQLNNQLGEGSFATNAPGYGTSVQLFLYKSNYQGCYGRSYYVNRTVFEFDRIATKCADVN
eukprot:TRINITY_DN404_c0_g1_i3.p1 TRINITY_DN404_c0_g1~~TRINITY_DN404_c0_g1_i3.p1  ORF type:complete len:125 (+),score=7.82 TRINITY_DN404_c0_g1_i3:259-633(+)